MKAQLADCSVIPGDRTATAKCRMKTYFDKQHCTKSDLALGSMVLVCTPGLSSKFSDSWQCPYEVLRQISPVIWEIYVPNSPRKKRVIHANLLKQWHAPEGRALRVVLAIEDNTVSPPVEFGSPCVLSPDQSKWLQDSQVEFVDILSGTGCTSILEHAIDRGQTKPFRLPQYWQPAVLLSAIKNALDLLLTEHIIKPSLNPWSSPLLPVEKKDGSIRLCVDFRRLNAVKVPDPYLMPRIDSIIDNLGNALFLSKLDLAKGFHQVPLRIGLRPLSVVPGVSTRCGMRQQHSD